MRARTARIPVKDKQQLVEELRKAVVDATAFCAAHGVMLDEIEATAAGSMERLQRIEDGDERADFARPAAPRLLWP